MQVTAGVLVPLLWRTSPDCADRAPAAIILCYVMLYYVISYYMILCYIMFYYITLSAHQFCLNMPEHKSWYIAALLQTNVCPDPVWKLSNHNKASHGLGIEQTHDPRSHQLRSTLAGADRTGQVLLLVIMTMIMISLSLSLYIYIYIYVIIT